MDSRMKLEALRIFRTFTAVAPKQSQKPLIVVSLPAVTPFPLEDVRSMYSLGYREDMPTSLFLPEKND